MAYTPINWQTGDTITAEKLNKMDNGWGYEETELFSETVTTAESSGMYSATLDYSDTIDDASITVTFDGVEYTCSRIDEFGEYFYGGFASSGPVFTTYPFAIESNPNSGVNRVYTETAGTYDIAVEGSAVVASEDFEKAVNSCIVSQEIPHLLINVMDSSTVLSWDEINSAFTNGYICVVSGFGPVLQMWDDGSRCYMATGGTSPQNGKFDPAIWRTAGASSDLTMSFYKYDSQMP